MRRKSSLFYRDFWVVIYALFSSPLNGLFVLCFRLFDFKSGVVVGNGEKWRDFDGLEWRLTVEGNTTLPPVKQKTERSLCE